MTKTAAFAAATEDVAPGDLAQALVELLAAAGAQTGQVVASGRGAGVAVKLPNGQVYRLNVEESF